LISISIMGDLVKHAKAARGMIAVLSVAVAAFPAMAVFGLPFFRVGVGGEKGDL